MQVIDVSGSVSVSIFPTPLDGTTYHSNDPYYCSAHEEQEHHCRPKLVEPRRARFGDDVRYYAEHDPSENYASANLFEKHGAVSALFFTLHPLPFTVCPA
jgi:hypothetical protein